MNERGACGGNFWCGAFAAAVIAIAPTTQADSFQLYWADYGHGTVPFNNGRLERSSLDGSTRETIFFDALDTPSGLALDLQRDQVYWASNHSQSIQRSNLDGTGVTTILDWDLTEASLGAIAIDSREQKLYWTDIGVPGVRRANLDGSDVENVVVLDFFGAQPEGIALDLVHNKVYWSDRGADKIQRSNLDGSGVEDFVTNIAEPRGIAIDPIHQRLYYADADAAGISRINLDGSGHEGVLFADSTPWGIALDPAAGKMYWTETQFLFSRDLPAIKMANLDGSNIETIFGPNDGLNMPRHLALIPEPTTLVLLCLGAMLRSRAGGIHRGRRRQQRARMRMR